MSAKQDPSPSALRPNLVLTGFMGSGKSAVGRRIAALHDMPFVDLDARIEGEAGRSVDALFALEGETGFRRRERRAVRWVSARRGQVIATGGGAVLDPCNRDRLARTGVLVCLQVRPATVIRRLGPDDTRPLLRDPDRAARIRALMDARRMAYADRAWAVETDGYDIETVAREVWRHYQACLEAGCDSSAGADAAPV